MYSTYLHRGGQYIPAFIISLFTALLLTSQVYAQDNLPKNSFRVDPAFIEIDTHRDPADKQFPIKYSNLSGQSMDVELSFLPVTFASDDTRMDFPTSKSVLSSHIIPSADKFSIGPGETKTIVLSLADLDLLSSTDYYEALAARITTQGVATTSSGASVVANITTLLLVKNGGTDAFPSYSFENGSYSLPLVAFTIPEKLTLRLSNKGKTYGIPRGLITFTDMFGREVFRGPINTDSVRIFPGSTRLLAVKMVTERLALPMYIGRYNLAMYDAFVKDETQLTKAQSFLFIDPLFGVLALVVAPSYVLFLVYASHVKKRRKAMDSAARPAGK
ncbi:hypothetical protein KBB12_03100 [Candidatus Woesebacteria bacterium]|nr:hypothetical protein [Candidatus Woesebacteria bacterium]